MSGTRSNRRLAAILAADVVGYSRLMAADEAGTLAALKHHRETIFDPAVAEHDGRLVKLMGDGALVEFHSVVDAVNCALAIQRAPDPAIRHRIGINLGDVIADGDDIYGDGVNVAARLEPLADSGGICISAIVNESIGSRVDAAFVDGGEVQVKNLARPIRVWKWSPVLDSTTGRSAEPPQPAAISIAVLPFANISGDSEQEYFCDGITEDIITDLSKVPGLLVIARNSSFVFKGRSVDIPTVARELRVKTVLEGSIRRTGSRVRVTAQLIDATTGGHLWADRFDRDLTDIFSVQDELTREIVAALKLTLGPRGLAASSDTGTSNIAAQDAYFRGRAIMSSAMNREVFARGTALLREAIAHDADFARPYAWLAVAHVNDYLNGWSEAYPQSLGEARRLAEIAIAKAPGEVHGHAALSLSFAVERKFDLANAALRQAMAINPNDPLTRTIHAMSHLSVDHAERAIGDIEAVMRADPAWAHGYLQHLGTAYLLAGKYEAAEAQFRERILVVPNTDTSRAFLAVTLGFQGRRAEAEAVWSDLQAINPAYDFESHLAHLPLSDAYTEAMREGLVRAGISTGTSR